MKITEIKITRIITEGKFKAVASITIDDAIAVHGLKIIQGNSRLFIAMPSRKDESGIFRDIVHPIGSNFRKTVENAIFDEYNKVLDSEVFAQQEGGSK